MEVISPNIAVLLRCRLVSRVPSIIAVQEFPQHHIHLSEPVLLLLVLRISCKSKLFFSVPVDFPEIFLAFFALYGCCSLVLPLVRIAIGPVG